MEKAMIIEKLSTLMKIDIDATKIYDKAIDKVSENEIKDQLIKFKNNHIKHISNLEELIKSLGGIPPKFDVDTKGLFLKGEARIVGTEDALRVILSGEETTNKAYDQSVNKEFPVEIRSILDIHNRDELDHIRYISNAINVRIWKQAA